VLLAVVAVWAPGRATAQVTSRGGSTSQPTQVNVTLAGDVTTSVKLQIDGSVDLATNVPTVVNGAGTSGIVNFGTYNVASPLLTGEKHRSNTLPNRGTYLVATLTVTVTLTGGLTTATVDVQRSNPIAGPPDVAAGRLLVALPSGGQKNQKLSWPRWSKFPEQRFGSTVFDVPPSTYVPGAGNLDAAMVNGDSLDHQIGIWVPDSQPAAPFSTLVTYTATAP
jgi:hypothetical protein